MSIESWLGFFRGLLYAGTGFVAIGTIAVSILSPKVDKIKELKIDELLRGNKQLQSSVDQYLDDLQSKEQKIKDLENSQKKIEEEAKTEIGSLQKIVENQKKELKKIDDVVKDRKLSSDKAQELKNNLSRYKGQSIYIEDTVNKPESIEFANQLRSIFKDVGWAVTEQTSVWLAVVVPIKGIVVIVKDSERPTPAAMCMLNFFNSIGFHCTGANDKGIKEDMVLRIGSR